MFGIEEYLRELTSNLRSAFGNRLVYIGLQGSYLRGDADENSDIDIMLVLDELTSEDLVLYKSVIGSMPLSEKSCGFICGRTELANWNRPEICSLLHSTKDVYGELKTLVPQYSREDVRDFVKMSVCNLFHELCHRRIHTDEANNSFCLPITYKSVFYILQNLYFLRTGVFYVTKEELLCVLRDEDKMVLETAIALRRCNDYDFDAAFNLIFDWCKALLINV